MSDEIGIDPVDLEELVEKAVLKFKGQYDCMTEEHKSAFKDMCRVQLQANFMVAEEAYQNAIDHVLRVFDVAAPSNSIPFIRDAIVKFKKV